MSATQEWIKQKFQEEGLGYVEYNNRRLTTEILELQDRIKKLEMDMAYEHKLKLVAESPEEQRACSYTLVYNLKQKD